MWWKTHTHILLKWSFLGFCFSYNYIFSMNFIIIFFISSEQSALKFWCSFSFSKRKITKTINKRINPEKSKLSTIIPLNQHIYKYIYIYNHTYTQTHTHIILSLFSPLSFQINDWIKSLYIYKVDWENHYHPFFYYYNYLNIFNGDVYMRIQTIAAYFSCIIEEKRKYKFARKILNIESHKNKL